MTPYVWLVGLVVGVVTVPRLMRDVPPTGRLARFPRPVLFLGWVMFFAVSFGIVSIVIDYALRH